MKKLIAGSAVALAIVASVPVHARTISHRTVTFSAQVPCAVVCTYWMPHQESPGTFAVLPEAAGLKDPVNNDPLPVLERGSVDAAYAKETSYACTQPSPEGSFDDLVLTAPRYATRIRIDYTPSVDWDMYLCTKPRTGNNGKLLASEVVAAPDECQATCPSYVAYAHIKAGTKYVLRAYNFSDVDPLRATYKFSS